MKLKTLIAVLFVLALGVGAGWLARHYTMRHSGSPAGRNVLYYQSAMHPWIKSDKPGKCTICGMDLTAVYEGESGVQDSREIVSLLPGTVTVINVQTEEVRSQALKRSIRVAGTVSENETRQRQISAYVDGRIEKLILNYTGAEVREGEPLAVIYSPQLLTLVQEYRVLAGRTNVPPGFQSEHERLLQAAAQRLQQLGLTDSQIQALPEREPGFRMEILAPISGTVVERSVVEGQYVREGDSLFRIADFSVMWFLFDAYEQDLPWLKLGQTVRVSSPSVPGKEFPAPITFIDPNIADRTRSAKVRVELENPLIEENGYQRRELLHRLYAEGVVEVEIGESISLPRTAVLSPGGQPVVYIEKGPGTYEQRKVKLGRKADDYWEVLEGVEAGELVVVSGNLLIDSQAQLNQTIHHTHAHAAPGTTISPPADLPHLASPQQSALSAFVAVADGLGQALAGDDLAQYNERVGGVAPALEQMGRAFPAESPWHPALHPVLTATELSKAADLAAARKSFYALSMALVELVKLARPHAVELAALKIYRCPMVNQAIPGAPKNGFWVQVSGPLRNPFFGAEMLDCGTEVKP